MKKELLLTDGESEALRITRKDCKKHIKCIDNMLTYYENAKSFLNDAQLLFDNKRYKSTLLCCQLALEDFGMAWHFQNLLYCIGGKADSQYNELLKKIKKKYKDHKFKIKSVTDFRFRYWKDSHQWSKLLTWFFHTRRLKSTYVEYDNKLGCFVAPKCSRKDAYRMLQLSKHYILGWGAPLTMYKKEVKEMIKHFGLKH